MPADRPDPSPADADTPADAADRLRAAQDRFIGLWGQMGSSWGIPRTMAEVHALLFIEGRPLSSDDVIERLRISRGNASMTLRALVDWGIVTRMHMRGDRREYYESEQDVWQMFRTIVRVRKQREVDPVLSALVECRQLTQMPEEEIPDDSTREQVSGHNARLDEMLNFITLVDAISERFTNPSGEGLRKATHLLSKAV